MKQILLTLFVSSVFYISEAQQLEVVTSSGGYTEVVGGSVSWTLGETFTETLSNTDTKLTQGFQQSGLSYTEIPVDIVSDLSIEMSVYPNPTSNRVHLLTKNTNDLSYLLLDENGKTIIVDEIMSNTEEIDLGSLPSAIYYLKVMQNNTIQKTYQIIKY